MFVKGSFGPQSLFPTTQKERSGLHREQLMHTNCTCTHPHTHACMQTFYNLLFTSVQHFCLINVFYYSINLISPDLQLITSTFTESSCRRNMTPHIQHFLGTHISEQLPKHYCNTNHNDTVNHKAWGVIKCLCLLSAPVKHLLGGNTSVAIATVSPLDAKLECDVAWEVPL